MEKEAVVIDSHALFWLLTDNPKLSRRAEQAIAKSSCVVIPSIVVMEILYILEKNDLAYRFVDFLSELKIRKYLVHPLDIELVVVAFSADSTLEMHDRIIVATAQFYRAPLISRDREIRAVYPYTIW